MLMPLTKVLEDKIEDMALSKRKLLAKQQEILNEQKRQFQEFVASQTQCLRQVQKMASNPRPTSTTPTPTPATAAAAIARNPNSLQIPGQERIFHRRLARSPRRVNRRRMQRMTPTRQEIAAASTPIRAAMPQNARSWEFNLEESF